MKIPTIALTIALLAAVMMSAAQTTNRPRNQSLDGAPLDPLKESARIRVKEQARKNFEELKQAAAELVDLSDKLNQDVIEGGEDVISARIFDRIDKIEKVTKRIRDKAKNGY